MGFQFVPAAEVKQKSHAVIGISAPAKTGNSCQPIRPCISPSSSPGPPGSQ